MTPLTELAHTLVRAVLQPGDIAIDATAGNGHDTQFLAECVGPKGTVYSFDIQLAALAVTSMRLAAASLNNVILLQRSHAQMPSALPNVRPGTVTAVMLNLGYLPGGDKRLTTQTASTITAIRDGLTLLAPGGIMTIVAYPGHRGGADEAAGVERFLNELSPTEFGGLKRGQVHLTAVAASKWTCPLCSSPTMGFDAAWASDMNHLLTLSSVANSWTGDAWRNSRSKLALRRNMC